MNKPEVSFTPRARRLLDEVRREHKDLVVLLDDTTCCTVSNVFARAGRPAWQAYTLGDYYGVPMCVHPSLKKQLKGGRITIDVLDSADDSLSLETDYGKRFIMLTSTGRGSYASSLSGSVENRQSTHRP